MTVSEQLRDALNACGKSRYQIEQETGVSQATLSLFLSGTRTLRLDTVDKLARWLGMALSPARPTATRK